MLVKLFATLKILPSTFDFHTAWEILKGVCVFIGGPFNHLVQDCPFTPEENRTCEHTHTHKTILTLRLTLYASFLTYSHSNDQKTTARGGGLSP